MGRRILLGDGISGGVAILLQFRVSTALHFIYICCKKNQIPYSAGQALRVPRIWNSEISRQSAHKGCKVVSPTHRPPLPTRKYSWYSFLVEAESTPGPQCGRKGYVNEKNPMTPSGIEPATFRLVAQYLNQHPVSTLISTSRKIRILPDLLERIYCGSRGVSVKKQVFLEPWFQNGKLNWIPPNSIVLYSLNYWVTTFEIFKEQ